MIIYDLKTMNICEIGKQSVVALGTFDGCHKGHLSVLTDAIITARRIKACSVVYTFDSIPREETGKECVPQIFTLGEKINFIKKLGFDYIAIEKARDVFDLSGREFYESILKNKLKSVCASCGYNYRFGKRAECDATDLERFYKNDGGSVDISDEVVYNGRAVSSTLIREKIESGEVEDILDYANPYSIYSEILHGKKLGRKMGIPTINQKIPPEKVIPAKGVYITECEIGEDVYPSVSNVGVRPTVEASGSENVETHIIGYSNDLYGSYIRVNFYKKIRDEKEFSSVEELTKQMTEDIKTAVDYFSAK